jgi:type I restriction enzyme S subunit
MQLLEMKTIETIFSELDTVLKAKIGDLAQTTSGSTPSRSQINYWKPAEIPWVKTAEVAFAPITSTEESISRKALQECSLTLLPTKTVLVAMYGQGKTRGQSAILEMAATTNQACFAILPNETWEPEFLYYWLKRSYLDLRVLSEDRGGNQANLNGALLKAFEVPTPEKSVQRKIVEKVGLSLEEINLVYESCNRTLADIQQIPNRLLSKAFEMN